jgi:hypothetical protein
MVLRHELPSADDVLRQAQEQTGLKDLDSDSWREGLTVLLEAVDDPLMNDGGRAAVVSRAVAALASRLQLHDYVQRHPEVHEETIEHPLMIMGMPRTGTTMASYMLAADPARRSLLNWETTHLVPPATTETLRTDPRCLSMLQARKQALESMMSSGKAIAHWEEADGPTECIFLHAHDFKALSFESFTRSTHYTDWLLDEADMTTAYEYEKLVLQVKQSRASGVWNLKMPSHAVHIEALLAVFPDARLVWAHRDPYKAAGSLCNLLKTPASAISDPEHVDPALIGQNVKRQLREHVMRPLRVREQIGADRIFDLYYHDLVHDPLGCMHALYDWAGDTLTSEVEDAMRSWLTDNPQHKFGVATYSLDEYDLSVAELEPVFEEYLRTFDIELEGTP